MKSVITVRDVDPGDKFWLQREAKRLGLSMEEFVRRLIHEKREKARRREKPSEAFRRYFGPDHGVDLPQQGAVGYRPVTFAEGNGK